MQRAFWAVALAALYAGVGMFAAQAYVRSGPGVMPHGHHRLAVPSGSPLDAFTVPGGAYSFRRLKSTYAGPALRLRRASDNLETDIAYLGCTGFTGCPWDSAAATAHCAATTCFLTAWYDQSGNARDIVQATVANQPQLIFSCNGSLPCVRQTGSATIGLATVAAITPGAAVSMSAVARRTSGTLQCVFIKENGGSGNRIVATSGVAAQWGLQAGASSIVGVAAEGGFHAANGVMDGTAASVVDIDGVETTGTLAVVATVVAAGMFAVGTGTCEVQEAMWWDPYKLTAGERAGLIVNQRGYWGTP
jgi:hypothetical protein